MLSSKRRMRALVLSLLVSLSFALQACPDKDGPMEDAGEKIDEAGRDLKRSLEDAAD